MRWQERRRRRRSINTPGDAHALTFSCYQRFPFLTAERTCGWLAEAIDAARYALDFALWAFVFMPEHVHLVVHPEDRHYDMSCILQAIKEPVGRQAIAYLEETSPEWLARVTRQRGTRIERLFWQSGGGFDENLEDAYALANVIDYVHLNPVRRGLVARGRDWRWSSAGWFEGASTCPLIPNALPPEWCLPEI